MRAWSWCVVVALMGFGLCACGGKLNLGIDAGTDAGIECGNGEVEGTEACDDGVDNSDTVADACRTDCSEASCGDAVVDTGEECDDGNEDLGDGCEACVSTAVCGDGMVEGSEACEVGDANCQGLDEANPCQFVTRAFRMNALNLLDPHIYTTAFGPNCADLTGAVVGALTASTQTDAASSFAPASSLDGLIDLGFVFTFSPTIQADGESTDGAFVLSDCTRLSRPSPPVFENPSPCSPTTIQPSFEAPYTITTTSSPTATCLTPVPDTTDFPVEDVVGGDNGCFVSDPFDFSVILGSVVTFALTDTKISAQWDGDPASGLLTGAIQGFISKEVADATTIAEGTTFLGGQTLSESFSPPGAPANCQHQDTGPGGEEGWYVYLTFRAEEVPWEGGTMCGNGVVDTGGDRDETCDPAIASGEDGECIDTCDDGFVCTQDTLRVGDPCDRSCYHRGFNGADGCCALDAPQVDGVFRAGGLGAPPQELSVFSLVGDPDCVAKCGDGTKEDWEVCEIGDATAPCDDPAACVDDGDACTVEGLSIIGSGNNFSAGNTCIFCPEGNCECVVTSTIGQRIPDDGCCPAICSRVNPPPPANCADDTDCD